MIRTGSKTALVHSPDGWREVNMPPAVQRPIPERVRDLPCVATVLASHA